MRFALIAAGMLPVPPDGWGAAENLIWNYQLQLEALGHEVDVYNTPWFNETIPQLEVGGYDFIHLHSDLLCGAFNRHLRQPFCITSHYGGFGTFVQNQADREYELLFRDTLAAPGNLVFSSAIRQLYRDRGYGGFVEVLPNPVEVERFAMHPRGNGRAICLGRIQPRKRQAWLERIVRNRLPLDFAGPYDPAVEPEFGAAQTAAYLGAWDRQTVYDQLGAYNCLVLLSRSEGDPLVVKEALAAGLTVVVNAASSGGLPSGEFITVLPDDGLSGDAVCAAIRDAIDRNDPLRPHIRDYARQFDYAALVPAYVSVATRFRDVPSPPSVARTWR